MTYDPLGLSNILFNIFRQKRDQEQALDPIGYLPTSSQAPRSPIFRRMETPDRKTVSDTYVRSNTEPFTDRAYIKDTDTEIDAWLGDRITSEDSVSYGMARDEESGDTVVNKRTSKAKAGKVYNKALGRYQTMDEARAWARQYLRRQGLLMADGEGAKEEATAPEPTAPDMQASKESAKPDQTASALPTTGAPLPTDEEMRGMFEGGGQGKVQPAIEQSPLSGYDDMFPQAEVSAPFDMQQFSSMFEQAVVQDVLPTQRALTAMQASGLNMSSPLAHTLLQRITGLPDDTVAYLSGAVSSHATNAYDSERLWNDLLEMIGA